MIPGWWQALVRVGAKKNNEASAVVEASNQTQVVRQLGALKWIQSMTLFEVEPKLVWRWCTCRILLQLSWSSHWCR